MDRETPRSSPAGVSFDAGEPLISVLVLNWNGAAVLPACLDALSTQDFDDFEVLVLDNASTDGSADGLEQRYPGFRVVRFESNLGFSLGNNRGAPYARGRWLAFLNNDAFPQPGWLSALARAIAARPDDSFFASLLVNAGDPGTIQAAGDTLHASGCAWPRLAGQPLDSLAPGLVEVFSGSGAAVVYPRRAFRQAHGFDEQFTSHLEDVDLGFRLRLMGLRCWLAPEAVVAHVLSASYGLESRRTVYQVQRNLTWLYFSDMPTRLFWKYLPMHLLTTLGITLNYMRRGRGRAVLRARWDALRGLPAALRKRRVVQAEIHADLAELERLLDRHPLRPFLLGRLGRRLRGARR
ncbi:MAG: glycosyltransferase family 2 protein [Chloroflexota bacterium]